MPSPVLLLVVYTTGQQAVCRRCVHVWRTCGREGGVGKGKERGELKGCSKEEKGGMEGREGRREGR